MGVIVTLLKAGVTGLRGGGGFIYRIIVDAWPFMRSKSDFASPITIGLAPSRPVLLPRGP
jgi:hypothetical protein